MINGEGYEYPCRVLSAMIEEFPIIMLTRPPQGFVVVDHATPFSNVIVGPRDAIPHIPNARCNNVTREHSNVSRAFITNDCFRLINGDENRWLKKKDTFINVITRRIKIFCAICKT